VSQHFIFVTITSYGPLTCSIITTTRKFFSILASVFIFNHAMAPLQWVGALLVFGGIILDTVYGKDKKTTKPT
jgi:UDP-galactose transporter B1